MAGGSMKTESFPRFLLSVSIPKGEKKMSDKINVMIVEDQAMPRQLFEVIIKAQPKFNLTVSIDNAAIADICCARHAVDLVLMDVVTKNGASGLVAAEK